MAQIDRPGMMGLNRRELLLLLCLLASLVWEDNADSTGDQACPCVEWTALDLYRAADGSLLYSPASSSTNYSYPSDYGASQCKAHDADLDPFCNRDGPPAWCSQEWCWVDKNTCTGFQLYDGSYFPLANAYYSYETCGDSNSFQSWYESSTGSPLGSAIDILEGYLWSSRNLLEEEYITLDNNNEFCDYDKMCGCLECEENEAWKSSVDFSSVGGYVKDNTESALSMSLSCLIKGVSQTYSKTAAKEAEAGNRVGYQYMGDQLGGSTAWWPNIEWCPDDYDPRLRPWYAAGATGPKDVVIVVDVSGSMQQNGRADLAQQATLTLLDTLEWKDYATIILFNGGIYATYSSTLVSVGDCERAKMKEWVRSKTWDSGGTNFQAAVSEAFAIIAGSVQSGHTSMCQKAILFLTDGNAAFTEDDYNNAETQSERYDVTFFTYALGTGADTQVCKNLACRTGGVFYPVPDGGDLVHIMSQYYGFFAAGQEKCSSTFTSYVDILTGTRLWPACLPFYDRREVQPQLLGVNCMDINVLADPEKLKEQDDGWDEFVCKISDMTKKCQAMYLTECQKEKIRLAYSVSSICESSISAEECPCLNRTTTCQDDETFIDTHGYFCDTWVGDDCTNAQEQWGYTSDQVQEVLQKCKRSCGQCTWTDGACPYTEAAVCEDHSFSTVSAECRACQTDKVSGIDIEGKPTCCSSQADSSCEEAPECVVSTSSVEARMSSSLSFLTWLVAMTLTGPLLALVG